MSAETKWYVTLWNGQLITVYAVTRGEVQSRFAGGAIDIKHWSEVEE